VIDSKRRIVHGERKKSRGVCASTITRLLWPPSAHISRLRATPGVWCAAQVERREGVRVRDTPWEFRGDDWTFRRIGQGREFVTTNEGLRYKANLEATLRVRSRTEAFMRKSVLRSEDLHGKIGFCAEQCAIAENADCQNGFSGRSACCDDERACTDKRPGRLS
jgi:hypothetical protein